MAHEDFDALIRLVEAGGDFVFAGKFHTVAQRAFAEFFNSRFECIEATCQRTRGGLGRARYRDE